ncbi:small multidrug efflux protein [Herbiconiux moechotypicola]|uniref:Small multidrug efflux protein n=1 Tax=Herbiconiux moechotypicola TaxID=637393 RepID=A0ABN3DX72_9MICO|nr:small multidrug efflux protein [Herbiconiux moechotypicola]MCS5730794.1 small multidrug efflux protein [Herbiconiux moechotypicola]
MNPVENIVLGFQDLVAQVPALLQPFIVMLAGAVPFVEGEVASMIGIIGGLNPIVAGIAAAAGNFAAVLIVVLVGSRARTAVTARRAPRPTKPPSKGRQRFGRWLVRFGVPGASILGPLAIPTQFTSAILVASGTPRGWVLLWQAVAIAIWTTIAVVLTWLALDAVLLAGTAA